ncbi:Asparagine synthase (glutamine-hydrolyzing) [Geitlerinema sp. PCC 7407]|nr:Asparagine synthase (glutamine-hydrolyzing) [Geitlerinema sp. PCC 7407]
MFSKRFQLTIPPTWHLAWGEVAALTEAAWKDEQIAIFRSQSPGGISPLVLSPSQRFVVAGDVWLSDRRPLATGIDTNHSLALSDLQWIAAAWERWGEATFTKLVGMFALAVWDRERQMLWLGRDRTGACTLYYTTSGSTRWVAPNLRSLIPYHAKELDLVALRDYLCCAFVPGPRTLWRQVRELRPGSVLSFPREQIRTYWQLQEKTISDDLEPGGGRPLEWHGQKLRTVLDQVVQECLPKQEPVGVFLSGGLDSSSVTALASKFHSEPVHTYSIHFGEACPNELEFSSLVAHHCGTNHHILEITFRQMWDQLPETMAYLDDPIGDPLTVPNLLVGRLAKESVRVVLNGEGGDPCFGGPKNQPMLLNQLYGAVTQQDSLQAYLLAFQKCASDLPQLLKPEIWKAVQHEPSVFSEDLDSSASYLNRLMALNIKFKGADQILTKVNNLTRAAGVQGRSPLFDQRIVELSMQIPPEYKLSGVQEKAVLKQAVADLLPEQILLRPKSGMMVPVQRGFRKYWQREAKALLLNRKAAIAPYLNQALIREWLNYRGDTWQRYGVKLWLLVSLEIWLQVNRK